MSEPPKPIEPSKPDEVLLKSGVTSLDDLDGVERMRDTEAGGVEAVAVEAVAVKVMIEVPTGNSSIREQALAEEGLEGVEKMDDAAPEEGEDAPAGTVEALTGVEQMKGAEAVGAERGIDALTGVERMKTGETAGPSFFEDLAGVERMEDSVFPSRAVAAFDGANSALSVPKVPAHDPPPRAVESKAKPDAAARSVQAPQVPPRTVIRALDIAGVAALVVHRICTVNARVVFANRSLIDIAQTTLDGVMGQHPQDLFVESSDADCKALVKGEPRVLKLLSDNQSYTITGVPADNDATLLVFQPLQAAPPADDAHTELFQLIGRLVAKEKAQPDSSNVTIYASADEDMCLLASASDLDAALVPLLRNAVEAAVTSRRKEVDVEVTRSPDEIFVTISDSGRGIDSEYEDRIFLAGISTKTDQLGVGLSQARAAARRMGGDIAATSTPLGAQFTLSIPASLLRDG